MITHKIVIVMQMNSDNNEMIMLKNYNDNADELLLK